MPLFKKRKTQNNDIFTPQKRSEIMSAVKGKNTRLETDFFALLRKKKLRFVTHYTKVCGKPDIAFPSKKIVVFIDSDFWHGWRYPSWSSKLTSDFWKNKIARNRNRDKQVNRILKKEGWKVFRFWEHQIKKSPEICIQKITGEIVSITRDRLTRPPRRF